MTTRELNKRREIKDVLRSTEKTLSHLTVENEFVLGQMGATDGEIDTLRDALISVMMIRKRVKDREKKESESS